MNCLLILKISFGSRSSDYHPHFPEEGTEVHRSYFPMPTQLVSGRARIQSQASLFQSSSYNHYCSKQLQRSHWGLQSSIHTRGELEQERWERSVQVERMAGHTSGMGLGKQNEAQLDLARALTEPGSQRQTSLRWGLVHSRDCIAARLQRGKVRQRGSDFPSGFLTD